MDINNINPPLIKGLEQKNTEQLGALSRVLNLVLGKTVVATISSTETVTEPERSELLKKNAAALAQIKLQASNHLTPTLKAEITRLVEQQNLIQSPALKWINLLINNRPLLTYSDRPLAIGQSVPVQLQGTQKLVLLDFPTTEELTSSKTSAPSTTSAALGNTTNTANSTTDTAKNTTSLNEALKAAITGLTTKSLNTPAANSVGLVKNTLVINEQLTTTATEQLNIKSPDTNTKSTIFPKAISYSSNDLSLKYTIHSENKNINPETLIVKTTVSENLRNLLPHKDTPNVLLSAINQLQQLPENSKQQLLSASLEQVLKSIAEKIRSPEQIAQPKALAQTLKNSGVFFEKKLYESVQKNDEGNAKNTQAVISSTYNQDLKGSLLTLLGRATQELNGDSKPLTNEQTIKLMQALNSTELFNLSGVANTKLFSASMNLPQVFTVFVQQLMQKPVKELSDKELRTQLLVLLQQHSLHSLAKIQLQQLHSLNHELESKDSSTPNASWQVEIPVKQQNEVHYLHMRIDREWVDKKKESEDSKQNSKTKQWSVTLRFDLPTLGEFCAQLTVLDNQVGATLWAEREKTFGEIRDHLEGLRKQLENEGIEIKFLQCMRGMPPEKPIALSYSLIDIST